MNHERWKAEKLKKQNEKIRANEDEGIYDVQCGQTASNRFSLTEPIVEFYNMQELKLDTLSV